MKNDERPIKPAKFSPLPVDRAQSSLDTLHPVFRERLERYLSAARAAGFRVAVYETRRSAARQAWLYAQGRTRPGKVITYLSGAPGNESLHQSGCAVDHVTMDGKGNFDWSGRGLRELYAKVPPSRFGLELLNFELVHVQIAGGAAEAKRLGIQPNVLVSSTGRLTNRVT